MERFSKEKMPEVEKSLVKDPLGKVLLTGKYIPGVGFYTKKTSKYYGGSGGGLLGKMYSKNDTDAAPSRITESDLRSWNPLQRFAYQHHHWFFSLGVVISVGAIGITYFVSTINAFYAVLAFCVLVVPLWYFMRTLFLIEGQNIPGAEYKPFIGIKDIVQDEPITLDEKKGIIKDVAP